MATTPKLTREEFEVFLQAKRSRVIYVEPYAVVPCRCEDVNCQGWRLVPPAEASAERVGAQERRH